MQLTLILFSAVLSVLALVGETWDSTQPTVLQKLTGLGKVTIVLIVFVTGISLCTTYQDNQKKMAREKAVRSLITEQVDMSLDSILSPFRALYRDTHSTGYIDDNDVTFDLLLSPDTLQSFENVCLKLRPTTFYSVPDAGTWEDILQAGIGRGLLRLRRLVNTYAGQMDPTLQQRVHQLLDRGSFNHYANRVDGTNIEERQDVPRCFVAPTADTYRGYLETVRAIDQAQELAG